MTNISLNPLKRVNSILTMEKKEIVRRVSKVSIPSSGSIQFLQKYLIRLNLADIMCLNPLKRVNSILTKNILLSAYEIVDKSLNPLKRVNSILTCGNNW